MLPRRPGRGRGRGGSRGRGAATPACIITAENPIGNPAFRAQLSRIIAREIERITGRTLWNTNRDNVPPARITRVRLIPGSEAGTRTIEHRVQNDHPAIPSARGENEAENRVTLPDGRTDTRTQFLNLFIYLTVINFVLNIYILHHLTTIRFF